MQDDNLSVPSDYGQDNRIVEKLSSDTPDVALYKHFREHVLGRLASCTAVYHTSSPYLTATSVWGTPVVTPRPPQHGRHDAEITVSSSRFDASEGARYAR